MAKRITELGTYTVGVESVYKEVDRAGLVESQNLLSEQVAHVTIDGATGAVTYQKGNFTLVTERLSVGSFRITHNLNVINYNISAISGNASDNNKICFCSINSKGINNFDLYTLNKDGSFTDPSDINVRVSFM